MPSSLLRWRPALWLLALALLAVAAGRVPALWRVIPGRAGLAGVAYLVLLLLGWPFLLGAQAAAVLAVAVGLRDRAALVSWSAGCLTLIGFYLTADRLLTRWARRRLGVGRPEEGA